MTDKATYTIATVSDIHGQWYRPDLHYPPADILILAGDILKNYSWDRDKDAEEQLDEIQRLATYLAKLPYQEIIVVAGNHDFAFQRPHTKVMARKLLTDLRIHYLEDEALTLDFKSSAEGVRVPIRFYGSPHQPYFHNWAFNFPPMSKDGGNDMRAKAAAKACWEAIPTNTDVLITHGPPHKIMDRCPNGLEVGCPELRRVTDRLAKSSDSGKGLKLHVFGHIHHSAGKADYYGAIFKNTALLGEDYMFLRDITVESVSVESKEVV